MQFWLCYMKGRRLRSLKKRESVKSAKRSKLVSESFGSVRRYGLSALASLPLCRIPPPSPCRGNSCRVLVQAKLVSPFLWITAVIYMLFVSAEGVFIVTNYMHAVPDTLARVFLVTPVGSSFLAPEPSHLASLARMMIRLYTQDPRCARFVS